MNYLKINRRSGILTISSVFLLLIAGGVVRSTGSGMGCPDWPKCYGQYLPPLCACELPDDYQDIYVQKRIEKIDRFAGVLKALGFKKQSEVLLNNPDLAKPEIFNPWKAWIEYINRIIGVLSGFFSLIFLLSLLKIRKYVSRFKFVTGVLGFIMMLFNAWLGSILVATNLFPVIISIHYLAAYAVLALFMLSFVNARIDENNVSLLKYKWFFIFMLIMSLLQVVFGTQLREISDEAIRQNELYKSDTVNFDVLGNTFNYHWFMAIGLVFASFIPVVFLRKKILKNWYRILLIIPLVFVLQYFSGVLNLRYAFPMVAQVAHIFFAGIIFGITLYICIAIFRAPKSITQI
ncbi:MAG: COX15/CtaA family protein [Bacteroidia bacterium]